MRQIGDIISLLPTLYLRACTQTDQNMYLAFSALSDPSEYELTGQLLVQLGVH